VTFPMEHFDLDSSSYSTILGFGSHDWDHLPSVHFSGDGVGGHSQRCPTYKLPTIGNIYIFGIKPKNDYSFN
jgi:hypothetical protein